MSAWPDKRRTGSVMQEWTQSLSMMQQTVLMTAIRGPDGIGKYAPVKYLLRWYRRCILLSSMEGETLINPYDMHLHYETEAQLDRRLGDNREQWLERNDKATVD